MVQCIPLEIAFFNVRCSLLRRITLNAIIEVTFMSTRKYLRLADGYHERSPYSQSSKYSSKQSNNVSENRSERSSNINGGSRSRNNSPRSRHSNMSPRSQRPSYSKTKELAKRGSSASPIERNASQHSSSSGDRVLKVDSISTDDSFPWSQHTSSSGKTYYYNCKTEKSQWEKPKEWLEREYQLEREKKKRETKERSDQSRDNSGKDKQSSRDTSRELPVSNKRDSQGHAVIGNKYNSSRERFSYTREESKRVPSQQHNQENKRIPSQQHDNKRIQQQHENKRLPGSENKRMSLQQHTPDKIPRSQSHHGPVITQPISHVVKTISANTTAVSTAIHRPDQIFARTETKASPSGSLQDVSPPVTPVITAQSGSPAVAVSPVITTRSPVMLTHRSPAANVHTPSPVQSRLLPAPHRTSTSTPPPPPPPIFPQVSTAQGAPPPRYTESSPKNAVRIDCSSKQQEATTFNGLHSFSQSQLHPLQQATLLQQAQFQGGVVAKPMTSGSGSSRSPCPSQFQPTKQTNSTPNASYASPLAPAVQRTSVAAIKQPIFHLPQQSVNLLEFANQFSRELVTHTLGWPADAVEKQAQRSADDTTNLCLVNSRLKADLIPLNFHQNLTKMRMGVGTKRIEFLRAQTRNLESSDAVS